MLPPLNRSAVGLALAPLVLAAVGVTHPQDLTPDTAFYWHYMHVALLPVFPLLGVNVWWLLAGVDGPLAWAARVLAFLYVVFYGALDVLAGIATGVVMERATAENSPQLTSVNGWLFGEGNDLSFVGVWAFLLACALAAGVLWIRTTRRDLTAVGGALLLAGAAIFLQSHIYFPVGVAAMLLLAAGFFLLAWAAAPALGRLGQVSSREPRI